MRQPAPAYGRAPGPGFVQSMGRPSDVEMGIPPAEPPMENPFADKYVRMGFIRKVYAILSVQLLLTTALVAAFVFVPELNKFAKMNGWISLISFLAGLGLLLVLSCCGDLQRTFPINFILLFLFTFFEALGLSIVCVFYKRDEVFMAVGVTATVFILLTIFAMQTTIDFTGCTVVAFVTLILLTILGVVAALFRSKLLQMIYACSGAALFSFYIVIDTQLITGGANRAYSLSPEDYIAGALGLYLDAINLFLYILQIMDHLKGDN
ncbi:protein lifeguard 1-like [Dermacentor andersoni]|uniref:protein lifeguard 1-like n=1 Tax=Dermacentor andersoni TaxID=34620 RepID=UPI0024164502|nr:protein lifeguard 1-like [Dermacentor andersoni]